MLTNGTLLYCKVLLCIDPILCIGSDTVIFCRSGIGQTRPIQIRYCAYTILCYCWAPRKAQKHYKAPLSFHALYFKCSEAVPKFNLMYRWIFKSLNSSSGKLFSRLRLSVILHSVFKLRVTFGYYSQTLFKSAQ